MTDFHERIARLQAHLGTRGVAEDVRDAHRFARDEVPRLAEVALQSAECKAGLRERITVGNASA